MADLIIGVLGLQGAIEDHEKTVLKAADELNLNIDVLRVILPSEIESVDGLIMPGGESTAMILIGKKNGMLDAVKSKLSKGTPAFGTCAGAILLSKNVRRTKDSKPTEGAFPFLNAEVIRNGYGRQRESFSTILNIDGDKFKGIFIRAPIFGKLEETIQVHATINDNPVFIQEGNLFATTFHPELSNDTKIHKMFLQQVVQYKNR